MTTISKKIENGASTQQIAHDIFRREYNNQPNFMTPTAVQYDISGDYAYEISKGESIDGGEVFGVTVLRIAGTNSKKVERMYDLNRSFDNEHDAHEYARKLGK